MAEHVVELGRVVAAEKNTLWRASGKPSVAADSAQVTADRDRSFVLAPTAPRALTARTERAGGQGGAVGVADDGVGLDALAVGQNDAGRAAAADGDLGDRRLECGPWRHGCAARSARACASRTMPPSTSQTPCCSTWAISISVAGAWNGEDPL